MGWDVPQALRTFPNHPDASVHRQPATTCLCSSSEQRGTGGGFSLKPEVNYALLDNFQLPALAIKGISSRWHAYLCTGREAHQPASPAGPQPCIFRERITYVLLYHKLNAQYLDCTRAWEMVIRKRHFMMGTAGIQLAG